MHGQARTETVRGEGGRKPPRVRHPWRLAALLAAAVGVTAGCSPLQLLGFWFSSDLSQQPKVALTIPGKDAKVLVVATHAGELPGHPLLMQADRDLANRLTRMLEERYKENKDRVKVVSPAEWKIYTNKHPRWSDKSPQKIGKDFNADWVIHLEINSLSMIDRRTRGFYHGTAEIAVTLTDVRKPDGEGLRFDDFYRLDFPRTPVEVSDVPPAIFLGRFLDRIAKDLAQNFATFPEQDKHNMESIFAP
jgi:hypothetical protein